jgi:hypothetical protein
MSEDAQPHVSDEFRSSMKEWMDIKKVIKEARASLKKLTDREKNLATFLKGFMKSNKIDTCNLRKGKVKYSSKQGKKAITKKTIEEGLVEFFDGDHERAKAAIECIERKRELKDTQTLRVSGLKSKGDDTSDSPPQSP